MSYYSLFALAKGWGTKEEGAGLLATSTDSPVCIMMFNYYYFKPDIDI